MAKQVKEHTCARNGKTLIHCVCVLDESDPSTQFTALRETKEEIGIDAESIDILGCYSALPNKTGSLKVYPYVGFIKDQVNLTKFNPDEVSSVFTLPIDYLIQPEVRQLKQFRESKMKYTEFKVPDHIEGEKQIWGLTSFILDGMCHRCTQNIGQGLFIILV